MEFQKLIFVSNQTKVTYKIYNDDTYNLEERKIPRTFIKKESSTIFNFLEDFPEKDFEFPLPFDVTEEEIDLLFYFLAVYSWEVLPQKYYSEYFLDKPDFWSDASKNLKKKENNADFRNFFLFDEYFLDFVRFEFNPIINSDSKSLFHYLFSLKIEDSFKAKLLHDLSQFYLQLQNGLVIDDDFTFLKMYKEIQKKSYEIVDYENRCKDNIWNNPVLYLLADFCGFDSFIPYFEKISYYKNWTERQKLIASTNKNFFVRFACIPYFLESFGKSEKSAFLITHILYEKGMAKLEEYLGFDLEKNDRKYCSCCMSHKTELIINQFDSNPHSKSFYVASFIKKEPLISKMAIQNIDYGFYDLFEKIIKRKSIFSLLRRLLRLGKVQLNNKYISLESIFSSDPEDYDYRDGYVAPKPKIVRKQLFHAKPSKGNSAREFPKGYSAKETPKKDSP